MSWGTVWKRRSVVAGVWVLALSPMLTTATEGNPLPPSCDPLKAGLTMPGCPSVVAGSIGDIDDPTTGLPDLVPDADAVYIGYDTYEFSSATGSV